MERLIFLLGVQIALIRSQIVPPATLEFTASVNVT